MSDDAVDDVNAQLRAPVEGWNNVDDDGIRRITQNSFVSGDAQSSRIRVAYFARESDLAVVGRAWFGPGAEGPPRHAHGGSMAALLDEVMGFSCWMRGQRVLAKKIEISFLRSLPLNTVVTFEGAIDVIDGKNVTTRGFLRLPSGVVCAEGTGLFVEIPAARLARMISGED
ncbi:MAG: PaaI family thioesterase [Deltaproteobacteria bacterium]|nr:PaaI family thioesterase [Deltaproteobacteria bacterium]